MEVCESGVTLLLGQVCADSFLISAFDYIYILFWNSIWTIAPVIGIGLFDRFLGAFPFS